MTINKAVGAGVVGGTAGMTGGITPLLNWLCQSGGIPPEVCVPFTSWLGLALTAVMSGVVIYYIPNSER